MCWPLRWAAMKPRKASVGMYQYWGDLKGVFDGLFEVGPQHGVGGDLQHHQNVMITAGTSIARSPALAQAERPVELMSIRTASRHCAVVTAVTLVEE
jgi:hypothetical protein